MSNQLKMTDKFQMAVHLKENWDTYKAKTQNELAGMMAHKFNRKVTRLNIASVLKMAGLRQEGRAGVGSRARGPSARTVTALARTMILVTEALRSLEPKLHEAYNAIEQWPAEDKPDIFSEGADEELDIHLLTLREHLAKVNTDGLNFGGTPSTAPMNDEELATPVTTIDEEVDNIMVNMDADEDEENNPEEEDDEDYGPDADAPNYEDDDIPESIEELEEEVSALKLDINAEDFDSETLSALQERIHKVQAKMEAASANNDTNGN